MNITLHKATLDDIAIIYNLAKKIWMHHYVPIVGLDQVRYMLENMYSSDSLTDQMTKKGQNFYIIHNNSTPIGFISISQKNHEFFIHKFYIDQDEQGKGIGFIVFNQILEKFPNSESFSLTVNRKNFKSINFYFKCGFVIDHIDDFDIGNGYFMNDFIMKWTKKDAG